MKKPRDLLLVEVTVHRDVHEIGGAKIIKNIKITLDGKKSKIFPIRKK
jgi:hypothetical protein